MKKTVLGLIIASTLLFSCGTKKEGEEKASLVSNFVSITDNEDKGIKEVLEYYGGRCEYSVGATLGGSKFFELKVNGSEVIEQLAEKVELPASNIAYLFYKNLGQENKNYQYIQTVIEFSDKTTMTFKYNSDTLGLVSTKIKVAENIVNLIKENKLDSLSNLINPDASMPPIDKQSLIENIEGIEKQMGNIKEFVPLGFSFYKLKNGRNVLHLSAMLKRDKQDTEFSIDVDPNITENEILILNYKL